MTLNIETPALLFSATSLILLAYTNRFLTIASIIRGLKKVYKEKENKMILLEINNLKVEVSVEKALIKIQKKLFLLNLNYNKQKLKKKFLIFVKINYQII